MEEHDGRSLAGWRAVPLIFEPTAVERDKPGLRSTMTATPCPTPTHIVARP
jgi:hypothetical protein